MRAFMVFILMIIQPTIAAAECDDNYFDQPTGQFVARTLRMASDVESPPMGSELQALIGQVVSFDEPMVWLDGQAFDASFQIETLVAIVNLQDPILSDIMVRPPDIAGVKNCWRMAATMIEYQGNMVDVFMRVDRRVLVLPIENGAAYLMLEKPLYPDEISRLQEVLIDKGFYDGDINGSLDAETNASVSAFVESRGANYRFTNAMITENLLAGLNVLRPESE
ncbi:MAG: hypothetical protein JKY41_13505 [Rhodobacteraceae bacterium]|nr:hypothetical protein [Paracoccaceae bacterium]